MPLTRSQTLGAKFLHDFEPIRSAIDKQRAPHVAEFVNHVAGALYSFGAAEQQARRAERSTKLDLQHDRGAAALALARRENENGLRALGRGRAALAQAKKQIGDALPKEADVAAIIEELRDEWRHQLVALDYAADEAEELDGAAQRLFDVSARGQTADLLDHLDELTGKLEELRRREDRGVAGNPFPVWKVIAAAVMLGAMIWLYFQCNWWGGCTASQAAIAFAIAAGASYFLYGC
jgi:hypothetical protein